MPSERNLPPDSSRSAEQKPPTVPPAWRGRIIVSNAFSADSSDDLFASVRAAVRESADFYAWVSRLCETSRTYAGTCDHAPGVACFKSDARDTVAKYWPLWRTFGVLNSDQARRNRENGRLTPKRSGNLFSIFLRSSAGNINFLCSRTKSELSSNNLGFRLAINE